MANAWCLHTTPPRGHDLIGSSNALRNDMAHSTTLPYNLEMPPQAGIAFQLVNTHHYGQYAT